MWVFGCAKVLNCRFQETCALSFVLPGMLSGLRYGTIVIYTTSCLLLCDGGELDDLVHPLANAGCSLYPCKPHFMYFSWWSFECFPSQTIAQITRLHKKIVQVLLLLSISPRIAQFTPVCFYVNICPYNFSYLELSKGNVISWIHDEQSVEIACLARLC